MSRGGIGKDVHMVGWSERRDYTLEKSEDVNLEKVED